MKPPNRRRWIKTVRRVHLYIGLFLVPWVILYGVSALLFNHPGWMNKRSVVLLDQADLNDTQFAHPFMVEPAVESAWQAISTQMGDQAIDATISNQRIIGKYRVRASNETEQLSIYISPQATGGTVYRTPKDSVSTHPFESLSDIDLPEEMLPNKTDVETLLAAMNVEAEKARMDRGPTLIFDAQTDQDRWRFEINLKDGSISTDNLATRNGTSTVRSFMTRLHKLHVYPYAYSARWIWSLIVDMMGGAMVVWGLTGLVMWWQMRRLRSIGLVVTIAGGTTIGVLATLLFFRLGY